MKNVYLVSLYVSESIICTKCMPIGLVTKIVEDYVRTYIYIVPFKALKISHSKKVYRC